MENIPVEFRTMSLSWTSVFLKMFLGANVKDNVRMDDPKVQFTFPVHAVLTFVWRSRNTQNEKLMYP